MRLISNKALRQFAGRHREAENTLQAWRVAIEKHSFRSFAELKRMFGAVDKVGDYFVFDLGGNKYRVIAAIHFKTQTLFVRDVFTHKEYDDWRP